MNRILLATLLTLMVWSAQSQKRGMAYGHHSAEDMEILAPHVNWWYNWSETPDAKVASSFTNLGFEFVPMTWNGNYDETKLRTFLSDHPETKYLLAFNEPNFLEQANMTPTEVAALWPELEAIADDFNLEIVGPAVNFCGECISENGTTYTDPVAYLDDFFAACTDCRVDHIAVHTYVNTIGALEWYIGLFEKYNKPIWLTEFAGWEENGVINNTNDQISFMESALEFLDNEPSIFRYAWFIGRTSGGINTYPYIDLLGTNGQLTALGETYTAAPKIRDTNKVVDIPAVIYAEDYNTMEGISLEKTSDETGDKNVGYIDANDWLEYKINVSETRDYPIYFRVAATQNSSLEVLIDGQSELTQSFTTTGGWQNWSTFDNTLPLTTGEHTLKLLAKSGGFNLNWVGIDAEAIIPELPLAVNNDKEMTLYPNPTQGTVNLHSTTQITKIELFTLTGKTRYKKAFASQNITLDLHTLPSGIYFMQVTDQNQQRLTRRISIKN
ncbi:glycosyl hydrolase [Reichenbachiella sp. MSK19-1]|uniref:glycosyl hydrolase n=1 Tax=Reichenbachiella sp. MSK19-1 TaxID=1897631 RepID=UPI000E6B8C9C|nr:glycosyl hydrolase [Reichenbachiella sp. MSK19-1]RJE74615.1 hypothetical protein BGP76_15855 [Reichenbachiella sp. MSK19-1]